MLCIWLYCMLLSFCIIHLNYFIKSACFLCYSDVTFLSHTVRQCMLLDSDRNKIVCTDGVYKNKSAGNTQKQNNKTACR